MFMVALSVGGLTGTALLVLIPEVSLTSNKSLLQSWILHTKELMWSI